MVNTTGTAFLGLTLGCARCHSHKFDPIEQREYYSLTAVFAGVRHGESALPLPPDQAAEKGARGITGGRSRRPPPSLPRPTLARHQRSSIGRLFGRETTAGDRHAEHRSVPARRLNACASTRPSSG